MKFISLLMIFGFAFSAKAQTEVDCSELKSEQIRLAIEAENLSNANTTRTPRGGPYVNKIIGACIAGRCEITGNPKSSVLRYDPSHVDADQNGYVAYPDINVEAEMTRFDSTMTKLKLLAIAGVCGSKLLAEDGRSSFMIRYTDQTGSKIKEDVFNLHDGQITSWMREDRDGHSSTINFKNSNVNSSQTF